MHGEEKARVALRQDTLTNISRLDAALQARATSPTIDQPDQQ